MFYGREEELAELNNRYNSEKFQFVPIYGRRRVGKTALIDEFIKDKEAVKFTAVRGSLHTNMRLLASKVLNIKNAPVMNLEDILDILHSKFADKRYILVIDEFPYLAKCDESVTGIINNFIESHQDSKAFIIVSGSSMNIMNSQILDKKSPLYGRRTGQIKLKPFPFSDIGKFLPEYSNEDLMTIYGLVGGIPWYLSFFDSRKDLKTNIIDNLINPYAVLNKESILLFTEEFESPVTYFDIISAIAKGHNRVGEIASYAGLETSRVSVLLKELIMLEIIDKIRPIDEPESKRTYYRIKDHYLCSFFRFIYPDNTDVGIRDYERVYNSIMEYMNEYLGHVFEDVCAEYVGKECYEVGTWWGTDPVNRTKEEIDIAALGNGCITLCECEYRSEPVDGDVIDVLVRRSKLVKNNLPRKLKIFSKSGYTDSATIKAKSENVELYTLEDITHN